MPVPRIDFGAVSPAASLVSTIEDMSRYLAFHLGGGALLGEKTLREMHRPQWLFDDWQTAWGLGVRVRRVEGRGGGGHPGPTPGVAPPLGPIPPLKRRGLAPTNPNDGNPPTFFHH